MKQRVMPRIVKRQKDNAAELGSISARRTRCQDAHERVLTTVIPVIKSDQCWTTGGV
jgi:hypothetical protein